MNIFNRFFEKRIESFNQGVQNIETDLRMKQRSSLVDFYHWHYKSRCALLEVCVVSEDGVYVETTTPGIDSHSFTSKRNLNTFGKDDWVFGTPARIITCDGDVLTSEKEAKIYLQEIHEQ